MSDSLEPEATEVPPNVVPLKLDSPYLGSRQIATVARARLFEIVDGGDTAVADADGVAVMTPSFADECFGGLLDQLGEDRFRSSVNIDNLNESCQLIIEAVLQRRGPTRTATVEPGDDSSAPELAADPEETDAEEAEQPDEAELAAGEGEVEADVQAEASAEVAADEAPAAVVDEEEPSSDADADVEPEKT